MTWAPPTFTEIKMDAEFTAYSADLEPEPAGDADAGESRCDSES